MSRQSTSTQFLELRLVTQLRESHERNIGGECRDGGELLRREGCWKPEPACVEAYTTRAKRHKPAKDPPVAQQDRSQTLDAPETSALRWSSMWTTLRPLMRRLLGVARTPTYYLPWLGRPGLECVLLLSNVESRFSPEFNRGPFAVTVTQYDADGNIARRYAVSLADCAEAVE